MKAKRTLYALTGFVFVALAKSGISAKAGEVPIISRTVVLEVTRFGEEHVTFTNNLWFEYEADKGGIYKIYSTNPVNALGMGSGCGGTGCNLKKGGQVATFQVKQFRKDVIHIVNATGDMEPLEDRLCNYSTIGTRSFKCSRQMALLETDKGRTVDPIYTFEFTEEP
jgi:hypothetical protein